MLSQYIVISVWYISAVYGMYPHAASGMKRVGREAIYAGQDDVSGMAREDPTMIYGRPVKKTGHATTSTSQDRQKENVDVSLEEAKEGISALGMKLEEQMKIFETRVDSVGPISFSKERELADSFKKGVSALIDCHLKTLKSHSNFHTLPTELSTGNHYVQTVYKSLVLSNSMAPGEALQMLGHTLLEQLKPIIIEFHLPTRLKDYVFDFFQRKNIKDGQVNKLAGWEYFFGSIDLLFKHGIIGQKSLNENLRQMQLVDQLYAYSKIFWDGKLLEVTRQDESYITQHWYFPAFHDSLTYLGENEKGMINLYNSYKRLGELVEEYGLDEKPETRFLEDFPMNKYFEMIGRKQVEKIAANSEKANFHPVAQDYHGTDEVESLLNLIKNLLDKGARDDRELNRLVKIGCEMLHLIEIHFFPGIAESKSIKLLGKGSKMMMKKIKFILLHARIDKAVKNADRCYYMCVTKSRIPEEKLSHLNLQVIYQKYQDQINSMYAEFEQAYLSTVQNIEINTSLWFMAQNDMTGLLRNGPKPLDGLKQIHE
ncbi:hypothetical protein PGTUg99_010489 [Puccinia graminis f. sp. tritici]|uniref:Uncharacterized protein n=1 Tax=Puccinia graminis f. sp. tritici TaxID=56615 RepID=A0A5B0RKR5_PUCGR|nr:hypothetical protein PGTUg99_010489 [Puccinia graminis f. sp. tritici]